jgi:hypothetical protein
MKKLILSILLGIISICNAQVELPLDAISLPSRVFYSNDSTRVYVGFPDEFIELAKYLDIPTKTSDLTNDSGFVTDAGVTSVSGTENQIVSTGGNTPVLSLHNDILAGIELANSAIQSDDLATVATTGDYEDLDNLPTIPAQLNPTAGTGISITGTYPNLTVTNTAPNVTQNLSSVLTAGNTANNNIVLNDGNRKTITYSGESVIYDYDGNSITVEFEVDNDYTHTLPNKNGTYAMIEDLPDLSPYATIAYVTNFKRPVVRVSTGAILSVSQPETRFIFTGTTTETFRVPAPGSSIDGYTIEFYNPTDYAVTIQVYDPIDDEMMNLTTNSIGTSISIPAKSGGDFFCDYQNDIWYANLK